MIALSLAFEYLFVLHKESEEIIFYHSLLGDSIDFPFILDLRRALKNHEVRVPIKDRQISHVILNEKYILFRAGKNTVVIMVSNISPTRFIQDALNNFSIRMETRWAEELEQIYTQNHGDLNLFLQETETKPSLTDLVNEIFHLEFQLPYALHGNPINLDEPGRKLWDFARELAKDNGTFLLNELIFGGVEIFSLSRLIIFDWINNFITQNHFIPHREE